MSNGTYTSTRNRNLRTPPREIEIIRYIHRFVAETQNHPTIAQIAHDKNVTRDAVLRTILASRWLEYTVTPGNQLTHLDNTGDWTVEVIHCE